MTNDNKIPLSKQIELADIKAEQQRKDNPPPPPINDDATIVHTDRDYPSAHTDDIGR